VPWGQKAFGGYLGPDPEAWREWDASELVRRRAAKLPTPLVDQGTQDKFLEVQLRPEILRDACASVGQTLNLRIQEGYDHSYHFVSTFMEDHLRHHAAALSG
jgi:S-formylglutathione hydrolase